MARVSPALAVVLLLGAPTLALAVPAAADPGAVSPADPGPADQPGDRPDSCDGVAEPAGPGEYEGTVEGADRDYLQLAFEDGDRRAVEVVLSSAAGQPRVAVEQFEPIVTLRRDRNALSVDDLTVRPADPDEALAVTLLGERDGVVCFLIRDARPANATGAWNWTLRLREPTTTAGTPEPTPASPTPAPTPTPTPAPTTAENVTLAPREGNGEATPGFGVGPALAALVGLLAAALAVRRRS